MKNNTDKNRALKIEKINTYKNKVRTRIGGRLVYTVWWGWGANSYAK